MFYSNEYVGEFSGFKLEITRIELFSIYFISILFMVISYFIYLIFKNRKIYLKKIYVNKFKLSYFVFFILVAQIIFLYTTGVGRLLSESTSPYSPFFSAFSLSFIFPIYYFICRYSPNKKFFWLNVFLYCLLEISKGWTSFLLIFFIFELHFFFNKRINYVNQLAATFVVLIIIFLLGGKVYQYVEPIKNEIRGLGYKEISFEDAISKFSSRLSYLPIAVGGYERHEKIDSLFSIDDHSFKEVVAIMRPLTPSFIMRDKDFATLNNDVLKLFYPNIRSTTSSDMGFFTYSYLLFYLDPTQFFIFLMLSIFLLIIGKLIFDSFEQFQNQLNLLWFLFLFKFFYTASLEVVFSSMLGFIMYIMPVMFLFGIVKLKGAMYDTRVITDLPSIKRTPSDNSGRRR